jgi:hypothetical protein
VNGSVKEMDMSERRIKGFTRLVSMILLLSLWACTPSFITPTATFLPASPILTQTATVPVATARFATITPSPLPPKVLITRITPDVVQVERWKDYETALAKTLLPFVPPQHVLCEWDILGRSDSGRDVYVWALCAVVGASGIVSAASAPALIHLERSGAVHRIEIPRDGTAYAEDIVRMFPAEIRDKFDLYNSGRAGDMEKHLEWRRTHRKEPPSLVFSATPASTATAAPSPSLSQQVTLVSQPFNEANQTPPFTLTAQTPQLTGSDDPRVLAFNQRADELVMKQVDAFRQSFLQTTAPTVNNGSTLDVTYTLISQIGDLWSFKFDVAFYADGAAHPGLNSMTLNYDLAQGKELVLADLFLQNSDYLDVISKYCVVQLSKQPFFNSLASGAEPTAENYRNWNITPDGLLITFAEYQVAPYAAGPQKVIMPYSALQAIIDPQGPLGNMAR